MADQERAESELAKHPSIACMRRSFSRSPVHPLPTAVRRKKS
jgi:hypothetical protein